MDESDARPHTTDNGDGPEILANLPRTRPQRASARRAAARPAPPADDAPPPPAQAQAPPAAPSAAAPRTPKTTKARKPSSRAATRRAAKPAARRPPAVPRQASAPQGFEPDSARTPGGSISPPSAIELLDGVVGAAGQLAVGTLDRGVRAVRGAVSWVTRR